MSNLRVKIDFEDEHLNKDQTAMIYVTLSLTETGHLIERSVYGLFDLFGDIGGL